MQVNTEEQNEDIRLEGSGILSKLDNLPFARWHIFVAFVLGFVWFFDGYQVTLISLYRQQIQNQSSETIFKSLVTAYQVGAIVGSLLFGTLAFVIGRRKIFLITLAIYFIGVLFSGIETEPWLFIMARFLTGLSIGGQFTAIFTAVDEFLPPSYRGRVNIGIDGTWHLGGTFASFLTFAVGETQYWRITFLLGWLGVVSLSVLRRNVPQSPRWLLLKHRNNEAEQIINAIQQTVKSNQLLLKQIKDGQTSSSRGFISYIAEIFRLIIEAVVVHTKKFLVAFILIFSQAFFFNLVYYQYSDILKKQYGLNQQKISSYMLPLSLMSFVSTIIVGPLFDKIGRRCLLLVTYTASGIFLIISYQIEALLFRQVMVILLFLFASPASSSANLIASEIFPTASRTIVLCIMFIMSMLGGIAGIWIDNYIVSSLMMIFAGIIAFLFCPNSENKTLEQIQKM